MQQWSPPTPSAVELLLSFQRSLPFCWQLNWLAKTWGEQWQNPQQMWSCLRRAPTLFTSRQFNLLLVKVFLRHKMAFSMLHRRRQTCMMGCRLFLTALSFLPDGYLGYYIEEFQKGKGWQWNLMINALSWHEWHPRSRPRQAKTVNFSLDFSYFSCPRFLNFPIPFSPPRYFSYGPKQSAEQLQNLHLFFFPPKTSNNSFFLGFIICPGN